VRLSQANVAYLSEAVFQPAVENASRKRIVHLGIGAFHRAHQAAYTQDAGDGWRITGVSLRSSHVRDKLAPQDGLYTLTERFSGSASTRLMTVIDTVLVAREDPEAVIAVLADPDTHVVTLTVTEKGYHRHPVTGALNLDHPAIASDLDGEVPQTIYGYLTQALVRRRSAGSRGFTLVSCDNVSGNGALLMRSLGEYLDAVDDDLSAWMRHHVAAPDTMVDRIVPASTAADRSRVAAVIGMDDAAAIVTEPFRQWVIEDRFAGPRPRWEAAGARIVGDVAPFELAKLRLLNASHSTLAYMGLQLGHAYVHEAIADPRLCAFLLGQMREEAVPCLATGPGLDPDAYIDAMLDRFANADLHHRLDQIAMDGSQKLPQRWIGTVEARLARHLESPWHLMSLAAWIAYTAKADMADDPLRARYSAIWAETGGDPELVVAHFISDLGIFPPSVQQSSRCVAALTEALATWQQSGPDAALTTIIA
jgi:fructuronate reductase